MNNEKTKTMTRIGDSVYLYEEGGFYFRGRINGKRTWRKLTAETSKQAKEEVRAIIKAEDEAKARRRKNPFGQGRTVANAIEEFLSLGCPDKKLVKRTGVQQKAHKYLLARPAKFFSAVELQNVSAPLILKYKDWAPHHMKRSTERETGLRTIDMELNCLSNVYKWAMATGEVLSNPLLGRPRFQTEDLTRHCRDTAPASAEELHAMADDLFAHPQSEVLGWQLLLQALGGCRRSEIVRLRMDAKTEKEPGYINPADDRYLFIQRSKKGVNPYIMIHPALKDLIRAHHHWHATRFPFCLWWLPGQNGINPVDIGALSHALKRVAKNLGLPTRTSHGLRSYFVTARRGEDVADWQIAREIGDKTTDLIQRNYGDRPENYQGGNKHTWVPTSRPPAWAKWLPAVSPAQATA